MLVTVIAEAFAQTIGVTFNAINGSVFGPMALSPFAISILIGFDLDVKVLEFTVCYLTCFKFCLFQMSPFLRVVQYFFFLRVSMTSLTIVAFGGLKEKFNCSEFFCRFARPKYLLDWLELDESMLVERVIILLLNVVFFRVLLYFVLKRRFSVNSQ